MAGAKLLTAGGGGVLLQPGSSIGADVTVNLPTSATTLVGKDVAAVFTAVQSPSAGTQTVTATGTFTYNPTTMGQDCEVTVSNTSTITLSIAAGSITPGTTYTVIFKAADTSVRTMAKDSTILAPGGSLPFGSLSTTVGSRDMISFRGVTSNQVMVTGYLQDVR